MRAHMQNQRGFAAIAGIFLVVILAALGGFMLTFSNTQQVTAAQDVQGARAYWAARAGLSWGVTSVLAIPDATLVANCPAGAAASPAACPAGLPAAVDGFNLTMPSCTCAAFADGTAVVRVFRFQVQASQGVAGSPSYIERSVSASLER